MGKNGLQQFFNPFMDWFTLNAIWSKQKGFWNRISWLGQTSRAVLWLFGQIVNACRAGGKQALAHAVHRTAEHTIWYDVLLSHLASFLDLVGDTPVTTGRFLTPVPQSTVRYVCDLIKNLAFVAFSPNIGRFVHVRRTGQPNICIWRCLHHGEMPVVGEQSFLCLFLHTQDTITSAIVYTARPG